MPKFNASQELREQIINIIDDLVNEIAPGYLLPNTIFLLTIKRLFTKTFTKIYGVSLVRGVRNMPIIVMKFLIFCERFHQRKFLLSPNSY